MGRTSQDSNHIHRLEEVKEGDPFECKKCGVMGSGSRHQCKPCNFNLHSYCATCPSTLTSPVHPKHELTLLNAAIMPLSYRCHICGNEIHGIFYHCMGDCHFDAHPLCVKFIADHPPPQPPPAPTPETQSTSPVWHQPYSYSHVPHAAPYYYSQNYAPSTMYAAHPPCYPGYTPYMHGSYGVPSGQVANNNMNNVGNYPSQGNNGQGNNHQGSGGGVFKRFMLSIAAGAIANVIAQGLGS